MSTSTSQSIADSYEELELIGKGSYGKVFKVRRAA